MNSSRRSPIPTWRRIRTMHWRSGSFHAVAARCSASTSRSIGLGGRRFVESLEIFSHLANVGDARSLVIHPASTTHFRMDSDALREAGIGEGTLRLSIGLEDAADLIGDLKRALKRAAS